MTPYDNPMKHVWWSGFNAVTGLTLVPIGMLGGALVTQAAMITGCILGSLSAVAACSPDDTFLKMGPMLGCGLGVIVAASLGSMFFPTSGLLMNVSLYGGLGVLDFSSVTTPKRSSTTLRWITTTTPSTVKLA